MNKQEQGKIEYSGLKEKAEISIEKTKELILENIPNEEIISIYVKGSYVHDELQPDSDVDIVVILKTDKYLPDLYKLTVDFGDSVSPPFQAIAYTLDELQTGKWSLNRPKNATPIASFTKHMDQLPLLYGSKPEGKLFTKTDEKLLKTSIANFRKIYLPEFNGGTFKFKNLIKQVIWLVEKEQRALGFIPDYHWQKLADSIEDKNHIAHDALRLRRQIDISKEEQDDFLLKLNDYLNFLEDKYKK